MAVSPGRYPRKKEPPSGEKPLDATLTTVTGPRTVRFVGGAKDVHARATPVDGAVQGPHSLGIHGRTTAELIKQMDVDEYSYWSIDDIVTTVWSWPIAAAGTGVGTTGSGR